MAKSGAETWEVDGKTIKVASTYYLTLPEGLQFTVDVEVPAGTQFDGMTGDKAFELAFPAMRHAYEKRLFERSKITKVGAGEQQVARIGVSLFTPDKFGNHGYRVSRTLEEIQKRIAGG